MTNLLAVLLATTAAASPFQVRMDTTRGPIVIEVVPAWAPRAAARFRELVSSGYYDDTRFFRVVKGRWAQFGINGDPWLAKKWRSKTFPDESAGAGHSNLRGTVAFAFAVADGRSTQVFVNLVDNQRLDAEGFAPFGRVVQGMENVDALYGGYGERSGGGIRGGNQEPLFEGGNAWLDARFPRLDRILRARVLP
jgi:cyclophilin family peptidyl-prolyl cis-trans isomerase